jgi:hypothetical protein
MSNNCWNMSFCSSCAGKKTYWKKETEGQVHIYGPLSHRDKRQSWLFGHFQQTLNNNLRGHQRPSGRGAYENHSSPCRESQMELQIPKSVYVAGPMLLKIISFPATNISTVGYSFWSTIIYLQGYYSVSSSAWTFLHVQASTVISFLVGPLWHPLFPCVFFCTHVTLENYRTYFHDFILDNFAQSTVLI